MTAPDEKSVYDIGHALSAGKKQKSGGICNEVFAQSAVFWIQRRYKIMKIIVAIAFYFLYWGVCFLGTGTDRKNLLGLRSYPEEVQNRVRNDPQLGQAVPKAKSTVAVLLGNFLLFTVVFSVLGLALKSVLNLDGYLSVFWYFLAFGEGLGMFDLLVIDLLWWRSKNASGSLSCRRRNTIKIRKSISNRFGAVSRCLPRPPHW